MGVLVKVPLASASTFQTENTYLDIELKSVCMFQKHLECCLKKHTVGVSLRSTPSASSETALNESALVKKHSQTDSSYLDFSLPLWVSLGPF